MDRRRDTNRDENEIVRRKCREKVTFYTRKLAKSEAKIRMKHAGAPKLRPYRCDICGMWHLTRQSAGKARAYRKELRRRLRGRGSATGDKR